MSDSTDNDKPTHFVMINIKGYTGNDALESTKLAYQWLSKNLRYGGFVEKEMGLYLTTSPFSDDREAASDIKSRVKSLEERYGVEGITFQVSVARIIMDETIGGPLDL